MLKTILITVFIAITSTSLMAQEREYSTRCCVCTNDINYTHFQVLRYFGDQKCAIYEPDDYRAQMQYYGDYPTKKKCFERLKKQRDCKKIYKSWYMD